MKNNIVVGSGNYSKQSFINLINENFPDNEINQSDIICSVVLTEMNDGTVNESFFFTKRLVVHE